jgi:hypothetical protein
VTSNAMPYGDYNPILGKYPGIFQDRRMATGKGLYETLGIGRGQKEGRVTGKWLETSIFFNLLSIPSPYKPLLKRDSMKWISEHMHLLSTLKVLKLMYLDDGCIFQG